MHAIKPPAFEPLSEHETDTRSFVTELQEGRAARTRRRRERSMERRFTWLFVIVVAATTLYLFSRTVWGLMLIHHLGQYPLF